MGGGRRGSAGTVPDAEAHPIHHCKNLHPVAHPCVLSSCQSTNSETHHLLTRLLQETLSFHCGRCVPHPTSVVDTGFTSCVSRCFVDILLSCFRCVVAPWCYLPRTCVKILPDPVAKLAAPITEHMNDDHPGMTPAVTSHHRVVGGEAVSQSLSIISFVGVDCLGHCGRRSGPFLLWGTAVMQ